MVSTHLSFLGFPNRWMRYVVPEIPESLYYWLNGVKIFHLQHPIILITMLMICSHLSIMKGKVLCRHLFNEQPNTRSLPRLTELIPFCQGQLCCELLKISTSVLFYSKYSPGTFGVFGHCGCLCKRSVSMYNWRCLIARQVYLTIFHMSCICVCMWTLKSYMCFKIVNKIYKLYQSVHLLHHKPRK